MNIRKVYIESITFKLLRRVFRIASIVSENSIAVSYISGKTQRDYKKGSFVYKIYVRVCDSIGRVLSKFASVSKRITQKSVFLSSIDNLCQYIRRYPVKLMGIFIFWFIIGNFVAAIASGKGVSLRGFVLRIILLLIGAMMYKVNTTFKELKSSSILLKAIDNLFSI